MGLGGDPEGGGSGEGAGGDARKGRPAARPTGRQSPGGAQEHHDLELASTIMPVDSGQPQPVPTRKKERFYIFAEADFGEYLPL